MCVTLSYKDDNNNENFIKFIHFSVHGKIMSDTYFQIMHLMFILLPELVFLDRKSTKMIYIFRYNIYILYTMSYTMFSINIESIFVVEFSISIIHKSSQINNVSSFFLQFSEKYFWIISCQPGEMFLPTMTQSQRYLIYYITSTTVHNMLETIFQFL